MKRPSVIIIDDESPEGQEIIALGKAIQKARDEGVSPATIAAAGELLRAARHAESALSTYATTGAFTPGHPSGWLLIQLRSAIIAATE